LIISLKGERIVLEEESIGALVGLGLTLVQSKVFLALVNSDCPTIHEISMLSNVPRQDIYRIVSELQELSLVGKIVAKPIRFQALPIEEACAILLKRKEKTLPDWS
jgi:sugar-specific transcriptional regulator TrmB